jgi:hypothetical protein
MNFDQFNNLSFKPHKKLFLNDSNFLLNKFILGLVIRKILNYDASEIATNVEMSTNTPPDMLC